MSECKKIAFFNHKGGVSKTTTVFNVGWMLASKGKKVIMVDADSQCNLTGMVMGFKGLEELDETKDNIKVALSPAFESRPIPIEAVNCFEIEKIENLYLLPGNIKFAEYDITLGMSQTISDSVVTLQNLPGSINDLLDKTAKKYNADYILIDMSPSLSSINQNLFMISDYFIISTAPDYFSVMALDSLSSILPKWYRQSKRLQDNEILKDAVYRFPNKIPKFLGNVIQQFNVRNNQPTRGFKKWFDKINEYTNNKFVPALQNESMLLNSSCYKDNYILAEISNFNSLITYAQEHNKPVFTLTQDDVKLFGASLGNSKQSIKDFENLFSDLSDKIISMTNEEC
ncbi:regulatory protein CII [hydrothermal vent metagenome]|uniref:Regulatory protein CII n=1 Tax=hydrothermal vent metagenome TaxID=652676 RepID=A0A1W1CLS1_9ZZZZ